MNPESLREYCLSLPMATEDMAFGPDHLLFRVYGKIFACIGLTNPDYFVLKADPDYAIDLKDSHPEITPAWHWNKKYWIQISLKGTLSDPFIRSLIRHSFTQVTRTLPKKLQSTLPPEPNP